MFARELALARFDRYVLSLMLAVFAFFAFVLVAVYWVNQAVRLFERLIADGQTALVVLEFTLLTLPNVMRLVLPVAAFVATLYATNRRAGESELVVMQATGVSPARLARPVALYGLAVAALMSVLVHWAVPVSRAELTQRSEAIERDVVAGLLVEGAFVHPVPGLTLFAREITELGELRKILLTDARGDGRTDYFSERAFIVDGEAGGVSLVMVDGIAMATGTGGETLDVTRFADLTFDLDPAGPSAGTGRVEPREMSTLRLLAAAEADATLTGASRAILLREGHERFAQTAVAALTPVLAFAVLCLGGYSRLGLTPQIVAAVAVVIVLQLVANAASDLAARSDTAWPAVYLAPVLTLVLALGTLILASRPRRRGVPA